MEAEVRSFEGKGEMNTHNVYRKVLAQNTQVRARSWVSEPPDLCWPESTERSGYKNEVNDVQGSHLISSGDLQFWPY